MMNGATNQVGTPEVPPGFNRSTCDSDPPDTGSPGSNRICVGWTSSDADQGKFSKTGIIKKAKKRFIRASSAVIKNLTADNSLISSRRLTSSATMKYNEIALQVAKNSEENAEIKLAKSAKK